MARPFPLRSTSDADASAPPAGGCASRSSSALGRGARMAVRVHRGAGGDFFRRRRAGSWFDRVIVKETRRHPLLSGVARTCSRMGPTCPNLREHVWCGSPHAASAWRPSSSISGHAVTGRELATISRVLGRKLKVAIMPWFSCAAAPVVPIFRESHRARLSVNEPQSHRRPKLPPRIGTVAAHELPFSRPAAANRGGRWMISAESAGAGRVTVHPGLWLNSGLPWNSFTSSNEFDGKPVIREPNMIAAFRAERILAFVIELRQVDPARWQRHCRERL